MSEYKVEVLIVQGMTLEVGREYPFTFLRGEKVEKSYGGKVEGVKQYLRIKEILLRPADAQDGQPGGGHMASLIMVWTDVQTGNPVIGKPLERLLLTFSSPYVAASSYDAFRFMS